MCKALALSESLRKVKFERITNILFSNMFLFVRKQNVYTYTSLSFDSEYPTRSRVFIFKGTWINKMSNVYHRIVIENHRSHLSMYREMYLEIFSKVEILSFDTHFLNLNFVYFWRSYKIWSATNFCSNLLM